MEPDKIKIKFERMLSRFREASVEVGFQSADYGFMPKTDDERLKYMSSIILDDIMRIVNNIPIFDEEPNIASQGLRAGHYKAELHKPECHARYQHYLDRMSEWMKAYPQYCRKCGGTGYHHVTQTFWEPEDWCTCGSCLDNGKCPLCGGKNIVQVPDGMDEYTKCEDCGWNDKDLENIECAPEFECTCYMSA